MAHKLHGWTIADDRQSVRIQFTPDAGPVISVSLPIAEVSVLTMALLARCHGPNRQCGKKAGHETELKYC